MRFHRSFPTLLFLSVLLAGPTGKEGQSPEARPAPAVQSDSLYRLGLSLLHRGKTEDGRYFDRARDAFREAHELDPDWAVPLLGIGLAEGGKGDWLAGEPLNIGTRVGHGAYRSSIRALVLAVTKDPNLTDAIPEMDRVAVALRDTSIDRQVLLAIRAAVTSGNDHPSTLLILGRRERAAGQSEASIANLQRYLSKGADSSLARYELARTLLTADKEEGVSLYFSAVLSDDSANIAAVRSDLEPIAEREELAHLDSTSGAWRQQFLRRFWEDRARRDLRSTGERLREHYRRLRFARHYFILSNNRRYYGLRDLYRAPRSETLDDRGVVYVRHGEPDQRIRPQMSGLLPNETWLYYRADGDLLMHFSAGGEGFEGGDLTDYRLVPSVFDLRGNQAPTDMLIASRFEISDLYEKIMAWGPISARRVIQEERRWGEESARTGTQTEGFELRFPRPVEQNSDLVAIGRRDGNVLLQVIYSLPRIEPGLPVRLRLALFDSLGVLRAWLDSTAVTQPMDGQGSGGRFELPAPPGTWHYRMALEVGESGLVMPRRSIVVPELNQGQLSLSGIALGQQSGNLEWLVTPADTVDVNPNHEFPTDGEIKLYYEVYGLESRSRYSAAINVLEKRRERAGRRRLRFNFEEEAQGEITLAYRSIRLTGLPPGEYWLEVSVADMIGRQATTRKAFRVLSVTH